ncbi:hypothetical protein ABZU76_20410 [Amycolatopsis sp. NPDC005232]|uniref:hypothetical protein n=1 Tax=Amycolatopsis sp. NPDC005232 TaxID=3157027 RepID=UPI0033B8B9D5
MRSAGDVSAGALAEPGRATVQAGAPAVPRHAVPDSDVPADDRGNQPMPQFGGNSGTLSRPAPGGDVPTGSI